MTGRRRQSRGTLASEVLLLALALAACAFAPAPPAAPPAPAPPAPVAPAPIAPAQPDPEPAYVPAPKGPPDLGPGVHWEHRVGVSDTTEADDDGTADRFTGCARFELDYYHWKQGDLEDWDPVVVDAGQVVHAGGGPLDPARELSFRPEPAELVVVHNSSVGLQRARCAP